ncbi:E3 ubiquitin-protein ligase MARCHF4-like [Leucoraja erinacea]|uniref:E3 ubiquitin-protein ligase MARCHF4-like n=1 Tax=Leucoraja erinaceus TaxID=7782 RepID=UPI0024566EFD|nr:E3 ubiquitin-protein ligase MARCHF4-like [Leucoraja erinacea]
MLRQVRMKCRCHMLFNDLKLLPLRRPAPPPSAMNYDQVSRSANVPSTNTRSATVKWTKWRPDRAVVAVDNGQGREASGYDQPAAPASPSDEDYYGRKGEDRVSLNSSIASGCTSPQCRICFQGPEQGDLLSPCRCAGSVRCTHQPCLIKWIGERGSWSCELCYYKYHVIAISAKNPLQWQAISLTVIERVQIAAAILGSLFLMASISWLVWSTISPSAKWQRQDLLFQICYGMYGFMDIVCIGLIIHEGPSVYRIFKRWQAVNQQWKVLNYEKSKDIDDQKDNRNRNTGSHTSRTHSSGQGNRPVLSVSNHYCAYTILHILSQLRPNDQRQQTGTGRELVMRVTTV